MGKGEIARYEQFLLFPQCFQKTCFPGVSLCGNGLIVKLHFFVISIISFWKVHTSLASNKDPGLRLIVCCLTPFSTVFQLYRGSQCTYPCFSRILFASTPHNILSKPLTAFPHKHCWNNRTVREEWILLQWLSSILEKNTGQARDWTSELLFSSPQRYWPSYQGLGSRSQTFFQSQNSLTKVSNYAMWKIHYMVLSRLFFHQLTMILYWWNRNSKFSMIEITPSYHILKTGQHLWHKSTVTNRFINVTHHVKRDLMGIAKSIDPGQPAQSTQPDHCQNFSLLADFLCINPFPHNDTFWRPWETSLLKTLWEKEKLLVTSNFSFTHSVFYPFG